MGLSGGSGVATPSKLKTVRCRATGSITFASAAEEGDTLDGVTLVAGDRIFLPSQSATQEGIFVVQTTGAPIRAADFDSEDDILGAIIHVQEGTLYADSLFLVTTSAPIVVGTTDLDFVAIWIAGRMSHVTTQSQYLSPNALSGVDIEDSKLEFFRDHGAAEDFAADGMRWQVGEDFVELRAGAKDAGTFQLFPLSPYDVELADRAAGGEWWHRDAANVIRNLATMESRKGASALATIASGGTSIVVTHGAGYTPLAQDIVIHPINNPTNDPGNWWVDTITATQFTIKVRSDPGASGAQFAWRVDR